MWFAIADVEKMTRKTAAQLEKAIASGRLCSRLSERGEMEIKLSSVLSAFAGEQAGTTHVDAMSQRIGEEWSVLWQRNATR